MRLSLIDSWGSSPKFLISSGFSMVSFYLLFPSSFFCLFFLLFFFWSWSLQPLIMNPRSLSVMSIMQWLSSCSPCCWPNSAMLKETAEFLVPFKICYIMSFLSIAKAEKQLEYFSSYIFTSSCFYSSQYIFQHLMP